ncbi:MAG: hypothetical protein C4320_06905, partial [Armatimonadota bacterium]
ALAAREGDETGARLWLAALSEGESGDLLDAAREVEGGFPNLVIACGQARAQGGDLAGAERAFARAVETNPADSHAHFCRGDALYQLECYADAVVAYESGLQLRPDHADGWFTLGNAVAQLGGTDLAMRCYREALSHNPEHSGASANLRTLEADCYQAAA